MDYKTGFPIIKRDGKAGGILAGEDRTGHPRRPIARGGIDDAGETIGRIAETWRRPSPARNHGRGDSGHGRGAAQAATTLDPKRYYHLPAKWQQRRTATAARDQGGDGRHRHGGEERQSTSRTPTCFSTTRRAGQMIPSPRRSRKDYALKYLFRVTARPRPPQRRHPQIHDSTTTPRRPRPASVDLAVSTGAAFDQERFGAFAASIQSYATLATIVSKPTRNEQHAASRSGLRPFMAPGVLKTFRKQRRRHDVFLCDLRGK